MATTVVLAIAGVLIAWAALQSAKWSGEQAIHFSASLSGKMKIRRNQNLVFSLALIMLVWASLRLVTLPIHAIP